MLNVNDSTSQSRYEFDFGMVEQVVIFPLEARMRLLLYLENNISGKLSRLLITLSTQLDFVAVPHTTINVDVENLPLDYRLLALALLATITLADDLSLSVTIRADLLESLNHRSHLSNHSLHACTITAGTLFNGTFLAAATFTLGADH
jgi:hypothetical protein